MGFHYLSSKPTPPVLQRFIISLLLKQEKITYKRSFQQFFIEFLGHKESSIRIQSFQQGLQLFSQQFFQPQLLSRLSSLSKLFFRPRPFFQLSFRLLLKLFSQQLEAQLFVKEFIKFFHLLEKFKKF